MVYTDVRVLFTLILLWLEELFVSLPAFGMHSHVFAFPGDGSPKIAFEHGVRPETACESDHALLVECPNRIIPSHAQ